LNGNGIRKEGKKEMRKPKPKAGSVVSAELAHYNEQIRPI
jgi:hypothetical protein